jgi:hypothetical protein
MDGCWRIFEITGFQRFFDFDLVPNTLIPTLVFILYPYVTTDLTNSKLDHVILNVQNSFPFSSVFCFRPTNTSLFTTFFHDQLA